MSEIFELGYKLDLVGGDIFGYNGEFIEDAHEALEMAKIAAAQACEGLSDGAAWVYVNFCTSERECDGVEWKSGEPAYMDSEESEAIYKVKCEYGDLVAKVYVRRRNDDLKMEWVERN